MSGLVIQNQTFAEIIYEDSDLVSHISFDGILGLGFRSLSVKNITPPLITMFEQDVIPQPIYSFYIHRNIFASDEGSLTRGEIILGGSDPNYYFGNMLYTSVTVPDYWQIRAHKISIPAWNMTLCRNCDIIVDTGTPALLGPSVHIKKILNGVGVKGREQVVDCSKINSFPSLVFTIDDFELILSSSAYINQHIKAGKLQCEIVMGFNDPDPVFVDTAPWVLGDIFIAEFYTEFDMALNRIGFALAKVL